MKVRKISIFSQMFLWLAILLALGNGMVGIFVYNSSNDALFKQIQKNAMNIAQCAAANVSGDIFQDIMAGDEGTEAYAAIVSELELFRDNAEIEYIYTLRRTEDNEFIFVVDSDPEEPAVIGDICQTTEALETAFREQVTTADDGPFSDEWGEHISAYSPIIYDGRAVGAVGVDINADWIDKQALALRNLAFITCAITYVASLLILQLLMLKFRKSMGKLMNKVKELASGSGDLTKEIDISTGDELEMIAGDMNAFIRQIRSLVKDVAQSTEDIIVTGEELNTTVSDNTRIMSHMNSEIEDISANMEKSSASSQRLSQDLSENAGHIAAFAENVNNMRRMVHQANEHAQAASAAAKENRKHALDALGALQGRMRATGEDAQKIEQVKKIAEEIGSIASQTRMLSFNAQIEAARAGAMGAGFAVVATEVGNLSNDIDRAVAEINMINSQVLSAVGALADASEEMIRFVSEEVVKDYDALADLGDEYGNTTNTIYARMSEIGDQSAWISKNITDINDNVQSIAATVAATAESANGLTLSTNKISASLENLNATSQKNSLHSEKLSGQISKYHF